MTISELIFVIMFLAQALNSIKNKYIHVHPFSLALPLTPGAAPAADRAVLLSPSGRPGQQRGKKKQTKLIA